MFHVSWCGYCKEMLPVWDRLAEDLDGELMVKEYRIRLLLAIYCLLPRFQVATLNIDDNPRIKYRFRHRVSENSKRDTERQTAFSNGFVLRLRCDCAGEGLPDNAFCR
jgi:thiol-disulfide isomerase/thioredoxin